MTRFAYIDDGNKRPAVQEQDLAAERLFQESLRRMLRLPRHRARRLLFGLLVELERIRQLDLTPTQRFDLLHPAKPLVRKAAAQLPKPAPGAPLTAGLTLEQRLLHLMSANLKRLMRDLDRPKYFHQGEWDERRRWTHANLMGFLGRQISYSGATGRLVPAGTWQELHDLFVYLVVRTGVRVRQPGSRKRAGEDFRFEIAYKRLLLLGLLSATLPQVRITRDLQRRLAGWSLDAWLLEPDRLIGRDRLILVEVAKDAPPRWEPATLDDAFRGWVLSAPKGFLDYLEEARRPALPYLSVGDGGSSMAA